MIKVSVILPIYNSEKYIKESIESILNQTFKDFELLAIYDNGTTDNSPQILNQYSKFDNRVVPINIGNKTGIVNALNYGIAKSKGNYIARMDADDISYKERFEKQVEFLDKYIDVDVVGTSIEIFGDIDDGSKLYNEDWFNKQFNFKSFEETEKIFLRGCAIAHPTAMIRKDKVMKIGGYREEYKESEDYDLWMRIIKSGGKIAKLKDKLLKYRMHEESKTNNSYNIDEYRLMRYVMSLRCDYLKDKYINRDMKYIIFGSNELAKLAKEVILSRLDNNNFLGYVSNKKDKEIESEKFYSMNEVENLNFDYAFLVKPEREEASEILNELGLKRPKDFIWIF